MTVRSSLDTRDVKGRIRQIRAPLCVPGDHRNISAGEIGDIVHKFKRRCHYRLEEWPPRAAAPIVDDDGDNAALSYPLIPAHV